MKLDLPPLELQQPRAQYLQIAGYLEKLILDGTIPPATRLPSATELAHEWNKSYVVVHRALTELTRTGLLERCRRYGTTVRSQSVIGILCAASLSWETAYFYRKLNNLLHSEIGRLTATDQTDAPAPNAQERARRANASRLPQWTARSYDGLNLAPAPEFVASHRRLLEDMRHHSFKGWVNFGTILDRLSVGDRLRSAPTVQLMTPNSSELGLDFRHFASESVRYLVQKGCRSVCYFGEDQSRKGQSITEAAAASGIPTPALTGFRLPSPERCFAIEEMAFQDMLRWIDQWNQSNQWPDGLIVGDDIMMRGVALALSQRGSRVPERLAVVCLTCEEIPHPYAVPVTRYAYSIRRLAEQTVALLTRRIRGAPDGPLPIRIQGQIVAVP